MNRKYEGVIVLNTRGKEASLDDMINKIGKQIEKEGAKLEQIDRMGRKELAYPSNKIKAGVYVNYFFQCEAKVLEKIRAALRLNDDVYIQHIQVAR